MATRGMQLFGWPLCPWRQVDPAAHDWLASGEEQSPPTAIGGGTSAHVPPQHCFLTEHPGSVRWQRPLVHSAPKKHAPPTATVPVNSPGHPSSSTSPAAATSPF